MGKAAGSPTSPEEARRIADKYFKDPSDPPIEDGGPDTPADKTPKLTAKQALFVKEYLVDKNATQAAIRAGYSEKTATAIGYENLTKPHIRRLITEGLKELEARADWNAERVLRRLAEEVTADIADLYDENNQIKPIREWPLIFRTGLVAGIEIETKNTGYPDDDDVLSTTTIAKVKLSDRIKRIEMLGKHVDVQAFKERKEVGVDEPLRRLYQEIAGRSIGYGLHEPPAGIAPPPGPAATKGPSAIRPHDDDEDDT